jgi:creatinine amidohydrolase
MIVTPLVSYGVSPHHMSFAGSVTLRHETFIDLIEDIGRSLARHGAKRIVIMNSHGGNTAALSIALRKLFEEGLWGVSIEWWEIAADLVKKTFDPPHFHADEMETSVAWALGQRVLEDKRIDEPGREPIPGFTKATMFPDPPNFSPIVDMTDYTNSGTVGYATRASSEKGEKIVEAVIERVSAFIKKMVEH